MLKSCGVQSLLIIITIIIQMMMRILIMCAAGHKCRDRHSLDDRSIGNVRGSSSSSRRSATLVLSFPPSAPSPSLLSSCSSEFPTSSEHFTRLILNAQTHTAGINRIITGPYNYIHIKLFKGVYYHV